MMRLLGTRGICKEVGPRLLGLKREEGTISS